MIKNLKLLRQKHKVSQQVLADAVGVSQQSINKYENHNIEPDIRTLVAIAEYFHTSVDYLIGHVSDEDDENDGVMGVLRGDEAAVLDAYRKLSLREKESIHLILENYRK